jgi:uncharacterized protein (TIGR01777 family)
MKIAVTGSTGFVGKHLLAALRQWGARVIPMGRRDLSRSAEELAHKLRGCDAVVNLAGAPISKRWTAAHKQEMVASRLDTTALLVEAMGHLDERPELFISTSAIGAFDSQGEYRESDPPNASDFLGELSKNWESAAREAETLGVRTLIFRFGLVLGADGGMMKQLLLPFRLGLGGPVGDGSQHFSWVHIDDLVNIYLYALEHPEMAGVYHICAPQPVTNLEFTQALGAALHRPTLFPVPPLILRLAFGEGADVMTSGQRVVSERLPETGFQFRYQDIDCAVQDILSQA